MTAAGSQRRLTGESLQELFAARGGGLEQLPMLRNAMEKAASACTEEMRALVGVPLRLSLQGIGAGVGADLLQGEGDGAVVVLDAPGWESKLLIRADRAAVFGIVEIMLGSDGSLAPQVPDRDLTSVEMALAEFYFGALSRGLSAAFAEIAATTFGIDPPMDEADLETMAGAMPVAIATYRLDVGGNVLVAIPSAALEAMRQPLSRAPSKADARPDPGWARQIRTQVTRADVTLTAILEERPGVLGEVFGLVVGQVIDLEATPQSRVRVECNGEALLWCDLGKSNGVYTLRVDSFVDREQEFMDDILAA